MGGGAGRGAALTPELEATLASVAGAMAAARAPWWVIGSAAVALHGGAAADPRDVDVMLAVPDAEALAVRLNLNFAERGGDPLFRSERFLVWTTAAMPVEFMAGFQVWSGEAWRPVRFATREARMTAGGVVFVPDRAELRALLMAFGRPKDLARAAMLS